MPDNTTPQTTTAGRPVLQALQSTPRIAQWCIWSGPVFIIVYSIGFIVSGFFPPTDPRASAAEVVAHYTDNPNLVRFGLLLMAFGAAFICPWAVAVASQMRRLELGSPLLTYCALGSAFFVTSLATLIPTVWAANSFRAGSIDPDITLALNDLGWFLVLFPWQFGGGVWFLAVGLSILMDKNETPIFPRWAGYAAIWFFLGTFGAGLIPFFDYGPFAWNGIMAFYLPFGCLFSWVCIMTWATLAALKKQIHTEGDAFTPPAPDSIIAS